MESETEYFKLTLKEEFAKRQKKNPNFSLRAFAKQLEIDSSTLSQIFNGKRRLTENMSIELGKKLRLSPATLRLIKKGHGHGKEHYRSFKKLEEDAFKVISEWYYFAILELIQCDNFKPSPLWISRVLGLPLPQTLEAIKCLKRLNYLEVTPTGKWVDRLGDSHNLGNERRAEAFTEHQRQVLKKALEALDETPYENRVQTSLTFAVSKARAKEAKGMILDFLEELNEFLRSGDTKDEVYNISVSLYPVSDNSGENHV